MCKWTWLVGGLFVVGLAAAACGGDDHTVAVPGGGQITSSGKVPDSFPKDFPTYDGAKVVGGYGVTQEGKQGLQAVYETGDSIKKVSDFYKGKFEKGPWKASSDITSGDTAILGADNSEAKKVAVVTIARAKDKTTIVVIISDSETASSGSSTPSSGGGSSGSSSSGSGPSSNDSAQLPDKVDLDRDFPKDLIPFPDDARVTSTSSYSSGGSKSFFVEVYAKRPASDLSDFYKVEMPKKGWTSAVTSSANGEYYLVFAKGESASANISIVKAEVAGYSLVTLMVNTAGK